MSRATRSAAAAAWAALGLLLWSARPAPAAPEPGRDASALPREITLLRSDAEGVRLLLRTPRPEIDAPAQGEDASVRVPRWPTLGGPGEPELPGCAFLVALPAGTRAEIRVLRAETYVLPAVWPRPVARNEIDDPSRDPELEAERLRQVARGRDIPTPVPTQRSVRIRDASSYAAVHPASWGSLGTPGHLRHLAVVPVQLHPIRWDPTTSGLLVAEELEVEVVFVRDPGTPPTGGVAPIEGRYEWRDLYRRVVVNGDAAVEFAVAPPAIAGRSIDSGARGGREPEFRLVVERTDLHRVTHTALVAAGWPADAAPVDQVALNERSFQLTAPEPFEETPVPILLRDLDQDGQFGPGDDLLFFAQTAWDRLSPPFHQKRYGRKNAYFLSLRPEGGARMAEAGSFLGREDLVPPATSVWVARFEGDGAYMKPYGNGDRAGQLSLGVEAIGHDPFLWVGGNLASNPTQHFRTFDLPGFVEAIGARFALQEMFSRSSASPVISIGPSVSQLVALETSFAVPFKSTRVVQVLASDLPRVQLREAANGFRPDATAETVGAAVNWMEWTYRRSFTAFRDLASWRTRTAGDEGGPVEYRLSGFSAGAPEGPGAVLVFDLSDSLAPRRLTVQPAQVVDNGRGLRLQFDLSSAGAPTVLTALRPAAAQSPVAITRELEVDLAAPGDEDVVIVVHDDFRDAVEPLAEQRRQQGLRVVVAPISAIYDQFEGGREWPTAIRSYLRYLARSRDVDPSFLLLFGDGSDDFAGVIRGQNLPTEVSQPNLVPTQTLFSDAHSSFGHEFASTDEWFVDDVLGSGETLDFFPDLHVGRVPVGNVEEAERMVQKLIDYDRVLPGETWRNRGLLVSDDEYSSRIGFNENYTWHGDRNRNYPRGDESVFRYAGRETRKIIHDEAGFSDFGIDSFFVAVAMDTIPCLGRCVPVAPAPGDCREQRCVLVNGDLPDSSRAGGSLCYGSINCPGSCPGVCDNLEHGSTVVSPQLLSLLDRGHLFVSFQGHANGQLMTHEYIYRDSPRDRLDSERLENVGKPFIFLGFGCHLAEFSLYLEGSASRGESASERMMLQEEGRGAIASIASTAYEWLGENEEFNLALMRAWWVDPPSAPDGSTRWLLGEIVTAGKYLLRANESPSNDTPRGMVATYCLLGDPTMGVDLGPPRLDAIEVNGSAWQEGDALVSAGESDTAYIAVRLRDEVQVRTATVSDRDGEVPSSRYEFVEDPEFPGDDRRRWLRYAAPLVASDVDYFVEIRATDRSGRSTSVRFPVRIESEASYRLGDVYRILTPSEFLAAGDSIRIDLTLPVRLAAGAFSVLLDEERLGGLIAHPGDPHPDGSRTWSLSARLPDRLDVGAHALRLQIAAGGDLIERSFAFQGVAAEVALLDLFNFPNPCDGPTRFHYTLNGNGTRATLEVFTLRGRKIIELDGPVSRGENVIEWDGRDRDGDQLANGLYFYRLTVETPGGRDLEKMGRLARAR